MAKIRIKEKVEHLEKELEDLKKENASLKADIWKRELFDEQARVARELAANIRRLLEINKNL